ncbi:MAG: right-handed parallel beta-helix repeat-containing protein, partial [Deltaproteobacteria bacterium]|nr:right-handed parallel beta-helix repeat-containing protein [Deltaproteobacteria bacterium]
LAACPGSGSSGVDAGTHGADAAGGADSGAAACPPGQRRTSIEGACEKVGWSTCAEGFTSHPSGWGCAEMLPPGTCPAGSFAVLGKPTCQAVGVPSCADGFHRDPSQWGCAPTIPAAACAGATREKLGSATCAPVGDCGGAFPPEGASLFVDDSYADGALDATHFKTIGAAIAAAADGAIVAVEEGAYPESLSSDKALRIVGRCAEKVVLQGALDGKRGLAVAAPVSVTLSGFSLKGFDQGVLASSGAQVSVQDCVLDGNRSVGVVADGLGGATQVTVTGSVIRSTLVKADGRYGDGAAAVAGASLAVEDSALIANHTAGLLVQDTGSRLSLLRTVVSGTLPNASGYWGYGIQALDGGELDLTASAVLGGTFGGVAVFSSKATLRDTVIQGVAMGQDSAGNKTGAAVISQSGELIAERTTFASIEKHGLYLSPGTTSTLTDCVVRDVHPPAPETAALAIAVGDGSQLTATRVALLENEGIGLILESGSRAAVVDSLVRGTTPVPGILATGHGVSVRLGSVLTATHLSLVANAGVGLSIIGADSTADLEGLIVQDTRIAPVEDATSCYGLGIRLIEGQLVVRRGLLARNAAAGILVDSPTTTATLTDVLIKDTKVTEDGDYGYGLAIQDRSLVTLTHCGIVDNRGSGLQIWGESRVAAAHSLIAGTTPDDKDRFGYGAVLNTGSLEFTDVAIVENTRIGFLAVREGAVATISDSLLRGAGRESDVSFGQGFVVSGGSRATLTRSTIEENREVAVLVDASSAVISACQIVRNNVAINVSGESTLSERAETPSTLGPMEVVVTSDTAFLDNLARIGTGAVPLPPAPTSF